MLLVVFALLEPFFIYSLVLHNQLFFLVHESVSDHYIRYCCWVVDLVEKKKKNFFEICSTLIITFSVDMFVCPSVRSSAPLIQWRFR